MGANIEIQTVCKILEMQDFHTIQKHKIDEDFFLGDPNSPSQTKEVFLFIKAHFHNQATYGSVPSWDLVQSRFYGFPYVQSFDTLPTLCEELRKTKLRSQEIKFAEEFVAQSEIDPVGALMTLREAASALSSQHEVSNDLLLSNIYDQMISEYEMVATGGGITGYPWPWTIMNEDTQGIHKQQFVVIYGRPKSMKSWVALFIAAYCYLKGLRVLVYSLEMTPMQILRRVACIIARVDYGKFKSAKLDPASKARVFEALQFLKYEETHHTSADGHKAGFLASQPQGESSGIGSLQAKIREFRADIAIVDGMYLMRDDRQKLRSIDWKAISHISQDLKQTARTFDIPIIATTQANRKADKNGKESDVAEVSYADAIGQDCDLALKVHKQKDKDTKELELVISLPASRDGKLDSFVIHGIAAGNFEFKRLPSTTDDDNQNNGPASQGGGGGHKNGTRQTPVLPSNWRPNS